MIKIRKLRLYCSRINKKKREKSTNYYKSTSITIDSFVNSNEQNFGH